MVARLSAVPSHGPGAVTPGETTKWPWLLTTTDVVTVDPRTGTAGSWRVTSYDRADYDTTVVTCTLPDGGDSVLVYHGAEQAIIRAHRSHSAPALMTDHQRCEAFRATTEKDRTFLISQFITRYGELFDAAYAQLQTARAADAACLREEIAS